MHASNPRLTLSLLASIATCSVITTALAYLGSAPSSHLGYADENYTIAVTTTGYRLREVGWYVALGLVLMLGATPVGPALKGWWLRGYARRRRPGGDEH